MEIYKELKTPASKEFEKLLNSQLSKNKIEEGKIVEGKIAKITDKFIFLFIEGLKSEPVLDINELKTMNTSAKHTSITVKHTSSAETNCGRKATKKSDSLGLRTFNSAPLIITRIAETLAFSSASQKVWPSRRVFQAI